MCARSRLIHFIFLLPQMHGSTKNNNENDEKLPHTLRNDDILQLHLFYIIWNYFFCGACFSLSMCDNLLKYFYKIAETKKIKMGEASQHNLVSIWGDHMFINFLSLTSINAWEIFFCDELSINIAALDSICRFEWDEDGSSTFWQKFVKFIDAATFKFEVS